MLVISFLSHFKIVYIFVILISHFENHRKDFATLFKKEGNLQSHSLNQLQTPNS